jgi:hypothetical protein
LIDAEFGNVHRQIKIHVKLTTYYMTQKAFMDDVLADFKTIDHANVTVLIYGTEHVWLWGLIASAIAAGRIYTFLLFP